MDLSYGDAEMDTVCADLSFVEGFDSDDTIRISCICVGWGFGVVDWGCAGVYDKVFDVDWGCVDDSSPSD